MKIPIFPGKYHQNGGFSMAMLVYRRDQEGTFKIVIFKRPITFSKAHHFFSYCIHVSFRGCTWYTLPETNSKFAPENRASQ